MIQGEAGAPPGRPAQPRLAVLSPSPGLATAFIRSICGLTVLSAVSRDPQATRAWEAHPPADRGRIHLGPGLALEPIAPRDPAAGPAAAGQPTAGLVLVVDGSDRGSLTGAASLACMWHAGLGVPAVVAVVGVDVADELAHRRVTLGLPPGLPVLACRIGERGGVRDVVVAVLGQVLDRLEDKAARRARG